MNLKIDTGCNSLSTKPCIRVGITEAHGMAMEASTFGPQSVRYSFLRPTKLRPLLVRSPIKAYMRSYADENVDLIEAVISPIITNKRWIFSCENFQAPTAFGILGFPLPRAARVAYVKRLLLKNNCRKVILWSNAGKGTLHSYGGIGENDRLMRKVEVIYPAVRQVPDRLINFEAQNVNLLFSGDFFRKGGVNVIDAFEKAHRIFPSLKLILCCDEKIDFNTPNKHLRDEYLGKVKNLEGIEWLGRITREKLTEIILPKISIYLLPTYAETFGMSILEAMAFGIPVIATNHFAIPEMIIHNSNGLLIDTLAFNTEHLFRGYLVRTIPSEFRSHVTEQLFRHICRLTKSSETRRRMGLAGMELARSIFSFETRNRRMLKIYNEALQDNIAEG